MIDPHPTYRPATLCEVCARFGGFCHWSQKGDMRPVPGWDAIRRDFPGGDQYKKPVESYIVLRCPLFEMEEHNRWAFERFDPEEIRAKYAGQLIDGVAPRKGTWKKVRCIDTGVVYPSVQEAARQTQKTAYSIRAACAGLTQSTRDGSRWEYVQEEHHE